MVDVKKLKEAVKREVDAQKPRLEQIARTLYENPELGSEEVKAAKLLTDELEKQGFKVERGILGMPTAFSATVKGGRKGPRIAILAEYDALPGCGHGCGHNLIAASAVGAGVAVSKILKDLAGEVVVLGTPAEEGHGPSAGSKVIMANKGYFKDVDAAIMLHPSSSYSVGGKALGISTIKMEFEGKSTHAAARPEQGLNALNAATLAYIGTHMLRQEARRDANLIIHGIISEGGLAMNVIPDRAVCDFGVRSSDDKYLDEMVEKVAKCAEGAAIQTGCKVKVAKRKLYSGKKSNIPLTKILWQNYKDQGVEITPWEETEAAMPLASTDFGDVSQKCPSTSSMIDIADLSVSSHSKGFADASITKRGFDAMIVGTKALAMTALELLAEPEKLKEAREFFDSH